MIVERGKEEWFEIMMHSLYTQAFSLYYKSPIIKFVVRACQLTALEALLCLPSTKLVQLTTVSLRGVQTRKQPQTCNCGRSSYT